MSFPYLGDCLNTYLVEGVQSMVDSLLFLDRYLNVGKSCSNASN